MDVYTPWDQYHDCRLQESSDLSRPQGPQSVTSQSLMSARICILSWMSPRPSCRHSTLLSVGNTCHLASAPEVFQRRMNELIEGLQGVEVVADDFVTVGFWRLSGRGSPLLERCWTNRVKLNAQKARLRLCEVIYPSSATYYGRKDVNVVSHNQPIMNKPFNCAPK